PTSAAGGRWNRPPGGHGAGSASTGPTAGSRWHAPPAYRATTNQPRRPGGPAAPERRGRPTPAASLGATPPSGRRTGARTRSTGGGMPDGSLRNRGHLPLAA